jgi:hypothetical protein
MGREKIITKAPVQQSRVNRTPQITAHYDPGSPTPHPILGLQKTAGNRAVLDFLKRGLARSGMPEGELEGQYEREADRKASGDFIGQGNKPLPVMDKKEESSPPAGDGPLPSSIRTRFETGLGSPFGEVRIHHGAEADRLSRAAKARALTVGRDIYFRKGEYDPETMPGRKLLAHELTHVVQQRASAATLEESLRLPVQRKPEGETAEKSASEEIEEGKGMEFASSICQSLGVATASLHIQELAVHSLETLAEWATLAEGLALFVESMIAVLEAMEAGRKWGGVMGASYAIVAIAHGQEPPPPGKWMAEDAREGWDAQASKVKNAMKDALQKNPRAFLASMARIKKMDPNQALDQVYLYLCEEQLQQTFLFFKIGGVLYRRATEVRLIWPGPEMGFR